MKAFRGHMSTRYLVVGTEYGSKTALQREWRNRYNKYINTKFPAKVSEIDRKWFVSAAHASGTHRKFLFSKNSSEDLSSCLLQTDVFIDKVARSFGPGKHKVSKHMKKQSCVFFASRSDKKQCRVVSNNLGDTQLSRNKFEITGWMRQAIQSQIDQYRRSRKLQSSLLSATNHKPYNCDICKCNCKGKENHIDHGTGNQSFKEIMRAFEHDVIGRPLEITDLTTNKSSEAKIRVKWKKFHKKFARLSLTCKKCNLTNK